MQWLRSARAIGGLLSIVVLLGLVAADFYWRGRVLEWRTVVMLLGMISALLGIDMIREQLPVNIQVGEDRSNDRDE